MTSPRISFADVKAVLLDRLEQLVRELFPDGGYASGRKYWMAKNPSRADANAGSFWIYMAGPKRGGWCDGASGQKGDVIQLIALARGGSDVDAKKWGQWWAGMDPAEPPAARQKRLEEADARKRQAEAEAAAKLTKDRRSAHGIWLHGEPLALRDGSRNPRAALAFAYLEKRGIFLERLPRIPGCTRLLADQRHVESGRTFRALGSVMIGADHTFLALHRVFIGDDAEKIAEKPQRKIWPDFLGGFIPVWDAGTGISAKVQASRGELTPAIVVEGIEDGFAAAIGNPGHRVRAAGSLGNLKHLPIFACDDSLTIFADNDWGKPQAQRQLDAAAAELATRGAETGCAVRIARSFVGKDANDLLKGE